MRQIEFEIHADFCWLWELRYVDSQTMAQTDTQTDRHDIASFSAITRKFG